MKTVPHSPFPVPHNRARRLLLSACCLILAAPAALAATMASQPWVRSYVATNDAARALAYGTPTRWTDATGCVWEVETDTHASWDADIYNPDLWDSHDVTYAWDETYNFWSLVGAVGNDNLRYGNGTWWLSSSILSGDYYCSGDEYATRLVFTRGDDSFVFTRSILATNLVGRVAYTNEMEATVTNIVTKSYVEGLGISGGGAPEWNINTQDCDFVCFVTNGMAHVRWWNNATTEIFQLETWPDGAAMMVRFVKQQPITSWDVMPYIHLVGGGTWPTNDFQSVWWRSGTNIFVNVLVEE